MDLSLLLWAMIPWQFNFQSPCGTVLVFLVYTLLLWFLLVLASAVGMGRSDFSRQGSLVILGGREILWLKGMKRFLVSCIYCVKFSLHNICWLTGLEEVGRRVLVSGMQNKEAYIYADISTNPAAWCFLVWRSFIQAFRRKRALAG